MSKHNLNEFRETLGGAAAMVFGCVSAAMKSAEPGENERIEICLNVRNLMGKQMCRWECRWMDEATDKIHTASSNLLTGDAPALAYYDTLSNLMKVVRDTRQANKEGA